MKYKCYRAPFFNHFIQPSPTPIAKLKSLHGVLSCQLPPSLCSLPIPTSLMITTKSSPRLLNLYALPSPRNIATMITQHTKFSPTARSPRQTWSPGYSLPHNFGPLSTGSVTVPIFITVFDGHLTPRSPTACVWAKILPILNVAP